MQNWLYSGASVMGQSHQTSQIPCQDKFSCKVSGDGRWLSVAVSDGAGSALNAEAGAEITSTIFCEELLGLSKQLESRAPGEWINDFVVECVLKVRNQLRNKAKSDDIKSFHCTLVAALVGPEGGFSIHIGDGSIFGGQFKNDTQRGELELNSNFVISKPENGEYTNETFFITEGNWIKHLRVTPLPRLDWVVACTDGGAALILEKEIEVKPKFLVPFFQELISDKFNKNNYISEVLSDPKANALTTDDKTIFVAMRSSAIQARPLNFTKIESSNFISPSEPNQTVQPEIQQTQDRLGVKKNSPKSIITPKNSLILLACILIAAVIIFATVKWLESDTKVEDKKSSTSSTAEAIKNDSPKDKTVEEVKLEDKSKEKDPDKDAKGQPSKDVTSEENKANENSSIKTNEEVPKKNKKEEPVSTNDASNYLTKILDQLKKIFNNK
jgi:hypothetical protein